MQNTYTKIAFFGTPKLAQIVLEGLVKTQYKPQLVVTSQLTLSRRGLRVSPSPVAETAQQNNLKIVGKIEELNETFELAILVAFGHIIPKRILEIPKFGFINIHPSLLPKYRGPSPIQSAILKGEKQTGVTIMKLDEEIDHGPVLAQEKINIELTDTNESLTQKLAILGTNLLLKTLPLYLSGKLEPKAQVHTNATYTGKITKDSGKIDINNPPAEAILDHLIRAYYPWPSVWFEENGKRFKLLPENKVQPEGKKPMTLNEFKNGYPQIAEKIKNFLV